MAQGNFFFNFTIHSLCLLGTIQENIEAQIGEKLRTPSLGRSLLVLMKKECKPSGSTGGYNESGNPLSQLVLNCCPRFIKIYIIFEIS